jgi:hypothetical protein
MTEWVEKAVTIFIHTHDVIGSNLARDTNGIAWGSSWLTQLLASGSGMAPRIRPRKFHFISFKPIIHPSSYQPAPYIPVAYRVMKNWSEEGYHFGTESVKVVCSLHWCVCLKHCSTTRKVAVLICISVVASSTVLEPRRSRVQSPMMQLDSFNWPHSSNSTMVLGSTKTLTEMGTSNFRGGKRWPARKADKRSAICEPIVWKLWEPLRVTNLWDPMVCYRARFMITNNSEDVIAASKSPVILSLTFRGIYFTLYHVNVIKNQHSNDN